MTQRTNWKSKFEQAELEVARLEKQLDEHVKAQTKHNQYVRAHNDLRAALGRIAAYGCPSEAGTPRFLTLDDDKRDQHGNWIETDKREVTHSELIAMMSTVTAIAMEARASIGDPGSVRY